MPSVLISRFRRWYDYERGSHQRVIRSLETVPETRRRDPDFQKALGLFAHVIAARQLWLHRFGVLPEGPETLFPEEVSLESLSPQLQVVEDAWSGYLQELDDKEIERVFDYRSLEGERYRNRVEDLLTQLFGHSWYHRGQIAQLVRKLGGEPAATDYVFTTRELIEE